MWTACGQVAPTITTYRPVPAPRAGPKLPGGRARGSPGAMWDRGTALWLHDHLRGCAATIG